MELEHKPGSRSVLATLLVVSLVLCSTTAVAYYTGMLTQHGGSTASSTIASLENTISSLQPNNAALQSRPSSIITIPSSSASPSSGLSPQQIYADSSTSVVTVQGDQLTAVDTIFGPQSVVTVVLGSGFTITYANSTYIVTNYHVVAGDSNLTVTFSDGNAYPAKVIGTDPYSDLAILTVSGARPSELVPLQVISSADLAVGQQVYAIGNPYGLSGSMTQGIISQLGRTIQDPVAGNFSVAGAIQFSAPINPGNSGGPLLNSNGKVIGITTATVTSSQGIGFAIPSSAISRDLPSFVSNGTYPGYSYLGIGTVDMNYQLAQASHTTVTYGVLIESVVSGGPGSKAGLRAGTSVATIGGLQYLVGGDIIVAVNGTKIVNQDALTVYLAQKTHPGETVVVRIIRSGRLISLSVVLGARPQA